MADLHDKILKGALGEKRLNPDEQRYYLGTFSERVVLTITTEDAEKKEVQNVFIKALNHLNEEHDQLLVKISSHIILDLQMHYLKISQELGINATIVDEPHSSSPFGVVVHTESPEFVDNTDIYDVFPKLLTTIHKEETTPKKSLFERLFNK